MSLVWALRHQTGEQYSAAECTRGRVAVCNVVAPAPQIDPVSQILLGNPRGPVEQANPNTCSEVKLFLFFLFILTQEVVCCQTEAF